MNRHCVAIAASGQPCKAAPLLDEPYCHLHHPDHKEQTDAMRRARGQRDKKEAALVLAYNLQSLESPAGMRRLLDLATQDALSLPDAKERGRLLSYIVQTATNLYRVDAEKRLLAMEETLEGGVGNLVPFRRRTRS